MSPWIALEAIVVLPLLRYSRTGRGYRPMNDRERDARLAPAASTHYAFVHGVRRTTPDARRLAGHPGRRFAAGSPGALLAAVALLAATWAIAGRLERRRLRVQTVRPPFRVGDLADVGTIVGDNLLVLALHAMACVAGFIAGSSLPLQAQARGGSPAPVHEHGGRDRDRVRHRRDDLLAGGQAIVLGGETAAVAARLHTSPGTLLIVLLPHALIELTALFLPLAAWIIASRRGDWDQLLAATFVTVAIALPMLVVRGADRGLRVAALLMALVH